MPSAGHCTETTEERQGFRRQHRGEIDPPKRNLAEQRGDSYVSGFDVQSPEP